MNKKKLLDWLVNILSIVLLLLCFETWRGKGVLVWLLGVLVITLYRLYARKDLLMNLIRYTETTIWGKPLEKEYWNEGEFKNTKVKLVWRKNKNGKTKFHNNKER